MRALDHKLWRDLWHMKGQALAIALVIMGGVSTFIMMLSTLDSLHHTRESYYRDYRFADVFVSLKRAPESLRARIAEMAGVDTVETRVVAPVSLDIAGFPEPVTGRLVSIPEGGGQRLNRLHLRQGRLVEPGREDEVVVSETFAQAHGFGPGSKLHATINGRRKALTVVGTALSPEYIYQLRPGGVFPDYKRYGVFWMGRRALGNAYDMEGAFNDVVLKLVPHASAQDVIDRLDALLEPYGGLGAYDREDQPSHWFLSQEFRQLQQMAAIFPAIFLGVAVFLLNVVLGRLVSMQREQIATLKAFGYRNREIIAHYLKLALMIVVVGVVLGVAVGAWLGRGLSNLYMEFFHFPFLRYQLLPGVVAEAALANAAAAALGTLFAVRAAARLRPAEAMRPEPPARYRETLIERLGLKRLLSQPNRMIARHIQRRPFKSLLTVVGIAFACGITMVGRFQDATINYMLDVHFKLSQRDDLAVTFVEPTSRRAVYSLYGLPGVEHVEVFRSVPVRLRFQHHSYRTSIRGVEPGGDIYRLLDANLKPIDLPPDGVVLTDYLGEMLGVRPGDRLTVEVLEGSRPVREVTVAALVKEYLGVSAYMQLDALNRFMREGPAISGAYLAVDTKYQTGIYAQLKEMPRVAGTVVRVQEIANFHRTMEETMLFFTFVATIFAVIIAFGVVYNSARIALAERGRELASLRVLGFTRAEVAYILLGELSVLAMAAIPLGFLVGIAICAYFVESVKSDLYRIPLIIEPSTYAFAATVVIFSAVISGWAVRRRLAQLDLIGVLKTRE